MPTFTPPTMPQASDDRLFGRYSIPVGVSVVKRGALTYGEGAYGSGVYGGGGTYRATPFPTLRELDGLIEGRDWFQGGRTYVIDDDTATALSADGFTVIADAGYGEAPFGSQGYGY